MLDCLTLSLPVCYQLEFGKIRNDKRGITQNVTESIRFQKFFF